MQDEKLIPVTQGDTWSLDAMQKIDLACWKIEQNTAKNKSELIINICIFSKALKFEYNIDLKGNIDFFNNGSIYVLILIIHCLFEGFVLKIGKLLSNKKIVKWKDWKDEMDHCMRIVKLEEIGLIKHSRCIKNFGTLRNTIGHNFHDYEKMQDKVEENDFYKNHVLTDSHNIGYLKCEELYMSGALQHEKRNLMRFLVNTCTGILYEIASQK